MKNTFQIFILNISFEIKIKSILRSLLIFEFEKYLQNIWDISHEYSWVFLANMLRRYALCIYKHNN